MGAKRRFRQIGQRADLGRLRRSVQEVPRLLRRPVGRRTDVCGVGGGDFDTGPSFAVVWLQRLPGRADRHASRRTSCCTRSGRCRPATRTCPADPGHPCDSPTDVLYPYDRRRSRSQHAGARLQPRRLLRALAAAGRTSRTRSGCTGSTRRRWRSASRSRRRRLRSRATCRASTARPRARRSGIRARSSTLDAEPAAHRPLRPLDGRLHRARDLRRSTLAQAASVTAVFGPAPDPGPASRRPGKGKVTCTPKCSKTFAAGNALRLKRGRAEGLEVRGLERRLQGHARPPARRRPTTR